MPSIRTAAVGTGPPCSSRGPTDLLGGSRVGFEKADFKDDTPAGLLEHLVCEFCRKICRGVIRAVGNGSSSDAVCVQPPCLHLYCHDCVEKELSEHNGHFYCPHSKCARFTQREMLTHDHELESCLETFLKAQPLIPRPRQTHNTLTPCCGRLLWYLVEQFVHPLNRVSGQCCARFEARQ